MNFQQRIDNLINKDKTHKPDKIFDNINFICVNEFNWTYYELMKTPIPFVFKMVNKYRDLKKAEKKAAKKK